MRHVHHGQVFVVLHQRPGRIDHQARHPAEATTLHGPQELQGRTLRRQVLGDRRIRRPRPPGVVARHPGAGRPPTPDRETQHRCPFSCLCPNMGVLRDDAGKPESCHPFGTNWPTFRALASLPGALHSGHSPVPRPALDTFCPTAPAHHCIIPVSCSGTRRDPAGASPGGHLLLFRGQPPRRTCSEDSPLSCPP